MRYMQILSCSNDLGSCCSDYGLVSIIDIIRRVIETFQIIVPILLLTMLSVQLVKLVINPEEKNSLKKITNRILSAVIIFFLPVVVNVIMSWLPATENFQVASCWKTAKDLNEIQRSTSSVYDKSGEGKKTKIITSGQDASASSGSSSTTTSTAGRGSVIGQAITNYALSLVGQKYVYGGNWNGELPYTSTDCSGFVQGVYKHFGVQLKRTTSTQWADRNTYTLVSTNDIRAGDLIMYTGHVGILTGNGNEVVHAANSKQGIIVTSNYKNVSGGAILGIMRIKGVN